MWDTAGDADADADADADPAACPAVSIGELRRVDIPHSGCMMKSRQFNALAVVVYRAETQIGGRRSAFNHQQNNNVANDDNGWAGTVHAFVHNPTRLRSTLTRSLLYLCCMAIWQIRLRRYIHQKYGLYIFSFTCRGFLQIVAATVSRSDDKTSHQIHAIPDVDDSLLSTIFTPA